MKIKPVIFYFTCLNAMVMSSYGSASPPGSAGKNNIKFLLGLRGGINFTAPFVLNRYSIFSNTSPTLSPDFKTYDKWYKNLGSQYGLIAMIQLREKTYITLQPSLATHNFNYTGRYTWVNPQDVSENTTMTFHHKQSLKYAEFPLLFRQDLTAARFRPYLQGGGFYSLLQSGMQDIAVTEQVNSSLVVNQIPEGNRSGSVSDQVIHTYLGLIAGGGLAYTFDFAMIGLDLQYKGGLYNITNKANRYSNQSLLGDTFDVPDDLSLYAWMVSFNVVFSLGLNKPAKGALKCP